VENLRQRETESETGRERQRERGNRPKGSNKDQKRCDVPPAMLVRPLFEDETDILLRCCLVAIVESDGSVVTVELSHEETL
jgi:hypothetical protein